MGTASFQLGALTCRAVSDGSALYAVSSFFCNAPKAALKAALSGYPLEDGKLRAPFNCLLVRTDAHTVLIDTGLGLRGAPGAGHLPANLHAAGVSPGDVDTVILSHAHRDHCGGLFDAAGELVFPRASVVLTDAEWDVWRGSLSGAAVDRLRPHLDLIAADAEILPGITAIPAPGHTPGQIALLLESEGQRLIYTADTIAHPLHALHPDWNIIADADRALAVETRRALLRRAADEAIALYVYHFPLPGLCRLTQCDTSWGVRWVNSTG